MEEFGLTEEEFQEKSKEYQKHKRSKQYNIDQKNFIKSLSYEDLLRIVTPRN